MFHFRRWTMLILMLLLVLAAPLLAQDDTLAPFHFGQKVTGELSEGGARVTYGFVIPPGQDVVIELEADHAVLENYCVQVESGASDCTQWGGGGGDVLTSRAFVIPSLDDAAQSVDLTIARPLDGAAQYSLVAYLMEPLPVPVGDILGNQVAAEQPYMVYTLEAEPTLPLTVEIEDGAESGSFLWVAYQPYIPGFVTVSGERQLIPQRVDGASRESDGEGISALSLSYLGGRTFRVLVTSSGRFSLHVAAVNLLPLESGHAYPVTVSYREPLRILRLATDFVSAATLKLRVVNGTGALVTAYTADQPYGDSRALGSAGRAGVPFPLSATIERAATGNNGMFVAVQIPFEFTRSQVTVEVSWQPD